MDYIGFLGDSSVELLQGYLGNTKVSEVQQVQVGNTGG